MRTHISLVLTTRKHNVLYSTAGPSHCDQCANAFAGMYDAHRSELRAMVLPIFATSQLTGWYRSATPPRHFMVL